MRTLLFAISGPLAGRHLARRVPYFVRNAHKHWWIIRVCAGNGDLRKHRNNRYPQTAALFPAAPGQTERPVRLQFMAGQVGLYIDVAYSLQRPDSKRPQALKSRVARAKRGESTPTALQTAPKSLRLSGLSSFDSRRSTSLQNIAIIAIFEPTSPRRVALGYTERPARVQFMLGRVELYSDDLNACQRPDSKRPQALKSRVARAKRCGSRTAAAKRCGSGHCPPRAKRKRHSRHGET